MTLERSVSSERAVHLERGMLDRAPSERTVTITRSLPFERGTALELQLPAIERRTLARMVPLLRYVPWAAAAFGLMGLWVAVRVDVQSLREDLDRAGRTAREARITNDRLRLELDARRRAVAMEQAAAALDLRAGAEVVRLDGAGADGVVADGVVADRQPARGGAR